MVPIAFNVTVDLKKSAFEYALNLTSPTGTIAIVGIPKESFSKLDHIKVNDTTIWDGTEHSDMAGVTWNGEDTEYVKFKVASGTWRFLGVGKLPVDSPKPPPNPPPNDTALDKKSWSASASVQDGPFVFSNNKIMIDGSAANAIDGDHWTGWRDMTKTQYAGQWFQLDMKMTQTFDRIELDNTWAQWDSPVRYEVTVSNDGTEWSRAVATGSGKPGITSISLPEQTARYIRIMQLGTDTTYHWSIFEVDVFIKNPAKAQ